MNRWRDDCHSAMKENETMPFAAPWMDLGLIILREAKSERQIPCDIPPMQNLKYDKDELIYQTETDSQT